MHIAQNWRLNAQRYQLKGVKCETCGKAIFPPREVCPHCAAKNINSYEQPATITLPQAVTLQRAAR